jgi:hypothetical protein
LLVLGLGIAGCPAGGLRLLVVETPRLAIPGSANLFLAAGLLCLPCRRYGAGALLGATAAGLGLTTVALIPCERLPGGYFCWQAALVLFWLGSRVLAAQAAASKSKSEGSGRRFFHQPADVHCGSEGMRRS